jgi:hypothetical protein
MAVSINNVYQKVLAIANKDQRGYITPQEFNLLADKAQNDIFEMYFHEYQAALINAGRKNVVTDDLDMLKEKIAIHRVIGSAVAVNGTLGGGGGNIHWLENVYKDSTDAVRTVKFTPKAGNNITSNPSAKTDATQIRLKGVYPAGMGYEHENTWIIFLYRDGENIHSDLTSDFNGGTVLSLPTTASSSSVAEAITKAINNNSPFHTASFNSVTSEVTVTYKTELQSTHVETVNNWIGGNPTPTISTEDATSMAVYEEINREDWLYVTSASKIKPTSTRPVYSRNTQSSILLYPTPTTTISCDYIKKPETPNWGYVVVANKALYNANTSTDFDLHASEESTLTNKILELAGIIIKDPTLSESMLRNEAVRKAQENK